MTTQNKKWSKTKIGAVIIGIGAVFATVGGMIQGSIDATTGITAIVQAVGAVAFVFGIRGLNIFNK
jgi:hypothetical protein